MLLACRKRDNDTYRFEGMASPIRTSLALHTRSAALLIPSPLFRRDELPERFGGTGRRDGRSSDSMFGKCLVLRICLAPGVRGSFVQRYKKMLTVVDLNAKPAFT